MRNLGFMLDVTLWEMRIKYFKTHHEWYTLDYWTRRRETIKAFLPKQENSKHAGCGMDDYHSNKLTVLTPGQSVFVQRLF